MAVPMSGKAMAALLIVALVVAASTDVGEGSHNNPMTCYCPCMTDQCMTIDGATREVCAHACDRGCREAGSSGQPNPHEFCGF